MISYWPRIGVALILLALAEPVSNFPSEDSPAEVFVKDIIAHYKLDGNGSDSCGISGAFELNNTRFVENTLYLNGCYEHGGDGYRAIAKVTQLNYLSFTISLEFKPLGPGRNILARLFNFSFEEMGNIITGGTSYRWFGLRMNEDEVLEVTLNNQDYVHTYEGAYVNSKVWNRVTCCVDLNNLLIRTFLNGKKLEEVQLPQDFSLRVVHSTKDYEDSKLTFTNYSNGRTSKGYVDNLRVFDWAIEDEAVQALPFEHPLCKRDWHNRMMWVVVVLFLLLLGLRFYLKRGKLCHVTQVTKKGRKQENAHVKGRPL